MPFTLELPSEYGYVLLVATSSFFVNLYHVKLTVGARKKAGLKYPISYASEELAAKDANAMAFNCAQRAHANFTENLAPFLGELLISGTKFPLLAAGLGAGWVLARILYATGYAGSGPPGRRRGALGHFVFDTALKLASLAASVMWVLGK